jgi:hypothetical protein
MRSHLEPWQKRVDALLSIVLSRRTAAPPAPLGPNPSLNQPTWVVDPSNVSGVASDGNAGDTEAAPLLHYREIVRRWNTTAPVITVNVDIEFMSDFPDLLDPVVCTPEIPNASTVTIRGKGSAVGAGGVLGVVIPKNRAAGQALNADLGAAAATAVGMLLLNTPRASVSYVDSIVAGTNVLMAQPFDAATDSFEDDGYAAGQAFTVLRPTQINILHVENVTLRRAWLPSGLIGPVLIRAAAIIESRIDRLSNFETFESCVARNSTGVDLTPWQNTTWSGGALTGSNGHFPVRGSGSSVTGDAIIHGQIVALDVLVIGPAYSDSSSGLNLFLYIAGVVQLVAPLYGNYKIVVQYQGILIYVGSAVTLFLGTPSLTFNTVSTGTAVDSSADPTVLHPGRALTPANLDAAIGAGGFGGVALSNLNLRSRISSNAAA